MERDHVKEYNVDMIARQYAEEVLNRLGLPLDQENGLLMLQTAFLEGVVYQLKKQRDERA